MLYCIKTPDKLQLKSYVCKYTKDIPVSTNLIQGSYSITNIRFYTYNVEIEIVFKGKIFGRFGRNPSYWISSDVLNHKRASKIRINRYVKKRLENFIESRLAIFGVELRHYSYIKKLKWI